MPLFFAFVLATVLDGVYGWTARRLGGRRVIGALVTTLGVLVVVVGPLAAVLGFVAGRLAEGLGFVRDQFGINTIEELRNGTLSANGVPRIGPDLSLRSELSAIVVDRAIVGFTSGQRDPAQK